MSTRKRSNYTNGYYQGYSSFDDYAQQHDPINGNGLAVAGRRRLEQLSSRKVPSQVGLYSISESRDVANGATVGAIGSDTQHLGARSLPYNDGRFSAPRGVQLSTLANAGSTNSSLNKSYGLPPQDQIPIVDGSLRNMYQPSDLAARGLSDLGYTFDGGLSNDLLGKTYGTYISPEEAKFAAVSPTRNVQDVGYHGRPIARDTRLVQGVSYGREDETALLSPSSPRAMPMSPRREDITRTMPMSPRREDFTTPLTARTEDVAYMMSPRREDAAPLINTSKRDYSDMALIGSLRLNREDDLLPTEYPMSPRREERLTPPMSPILEWDYKNSSFYSTKRSDILTSKNSMWQDSNKPISAWDVMPSKHGMWSGSDRVRDNTGYESTMTRGFAERQTNTYGARNDYNGMDMSWDLSKKGYRENGIPLRSEEHNRFYRSSYLSGYDPRGRTFADWTRNARAYPYNSIVNQRVGLVTKYIERERAEKSRMAKESTSMGRTQNVQSGLNKASNHSGYRERENRSATGPSKDENTSNKNVQDANGKSLSLVAAIENAGKGETTEKKSDKVNETKVTLALEVDKVSLVEIGHQSSNPPVSTGKTGNTEDQKEEKGEEKVEPRKKEGNIKQTAMTNGGTKGSTVARPQTASKPREARVGSKRPSLVMEIERVKRRQLSADRKRRFREIEETYYDAHELPFEYYRKFNRNGTQYARMMNGNSYIRRRYDGGGDMHCFLCGNFACMGLCEH